MLKRIAEPIALGFLSNIIVNYIFHPVDFKTNLEEFAVAILFFVPITELNRLVYRHLEDKIDWKASPARRMLTHFLIILGGILLVINIAGSIYMYFFQGGMFRMREIIIINVVSIGLAMILTLAQWAVYFYRYWLRAEMRATKATQQADSLAKDAIKAAGSIELQKGSVKIVVKPERILIARLSSGIVRVHLQTGEWVVFSGTLSQLVLLLPQFDFFQVARDVIIHRQAIVSISSSTYGKVLVTAKAINGEEFQVTVSRPKAAAFRRWQYSNSATNT